MKKINIKTRRGSLFLMLLVFLVVGGIFALRMIPSQQIESIRMNEKVLSQGLTDLRTAITLEREAEASALFDTDWSNPVAFEAYLNDLVSKGYLAEIPKDASVPNYRWGNAAGKLFWQPTENLVASSSFEVGDLAITSWEVGSKNIEAVITQDIWPGADSSSFDHFPNQNRFGNTLLSKGKALVVIQK